MANLDINLLYVSDMAESARVLSWPKIQCCVWHFTRNDCITYEYVELYGFLGVCSSCCEGGALFGNLPDLELLG